jgi:tRNA pseudouridine38-40 synthase
MQPRKILLTIQYGGADYHGWQIQPGRRTVQGELSDAVTSLVGRKVTVHGASRTDAGVSALGQVGLFEILNCPIPTENFLKAINDRLPDDIVITQVSEASPEFDLVGAVTRKLYRYTIYTGEFRPVLEVRHCWHIPEKLNVEAMNTAAQHLVGKHDFKSFASAKDNRDSSVRTVFRCDVAASGNNRIYIDIEGDGFLYNMVRNIVGSLVEVGLGRWQPDRMKEVLKACDRTTAGPIAPPQGLCLMWIKY